MSTTKDLRSLSLLELLSELKAALDKPKAEPRGSKYTPDSEEENESKPVSYDHPSDCAGCAAITKAEAQGLDKYEVFG
jgi:hypothetical protein